MNLKIHVNKTKTIITYKEKSTEHKTSFIKKMTVNDLFLYVETENLEEQSIIKKDKW